MTCCFFPGGAEHLCVRSLTVFECSRASRRRSVGSKIIPYEALCLQIDGLGFVQVVCMTLNWKCLGALYRYFMIFWSGDISFANPPSHRIRFPCFFIRSLILLKRNLISIFQKKT